MIFLTIQSAKIGGGGHSYATMLPMVISKLYQIQSLIPNLLYLPNVHYEHVLKSLIVLLSLSICFRMIYKTHTDLGTTQFE